MLLVPVVGSKEVSFLLSVLFSCLMKMEMCFFSSVKKQFHRLFSFFVHIAFIILFLFIALHA